MNLFVSGVLTAGTSGHFEETLNYNGDELNPKTQLVIWILASYLKGIQIDNFSITKIKTGEPASKPEQKVLLDACFSTFPERLILRMRGN